MMIDQEIFKREWRVLCERWNRKPSVQLTARYFQAITEHLDTEAFLWACRVLFAKNEFFPTPDQFIQAVRQPADAAALNQWDLCLRVMEGEDVLSRMTPEGQRTVALFGGVKQLRNTPLESVPFVRRDFLAHFREVSEGTARGRLLPGAEITPESRRIVREVMTTNHAGGA